MTRVKEKRKEIKTGVMEKSSRSNIEMYLKEINRFPLLSREEEELVAIAAMAGDKAARDKLVNSNLRFVVNVAKKYQNLGLPLEDLISEGNVGLMNAVDRFKIDKGCHFISYAVWWIRQAILSAICEKSRTIRLPVNRAAELVKIKQARKLINKQDSYEEEVKEIAELVNMKKEQVKHLLNISREILSLDKPVSGKQDSVYIDFLEDDQYNVPEKILEENFLKIDIENVLDTIDKDEANIIRCHYGLGRKPMSLNEIGAMYNLSKERIRQIEAQALTRLRNPIRNEKLQVYVA